MKDSEFDKYAVGYDDILRNSVPGGMKESIYFAQYKIKLIELMVADRMMSKILDYGCGSGRSLPHLLKCFPESEIWGFDVSTESLAVAKEATPGVFLNTEWEVIKQNKFDLIIAINVFHHILPDDRLDALKKCYDALNANGNMIIFEHNPYNPATRWIFEHCPFDVNAEMISLKNMLKLSKKTNLKVTARGYTLFFPSILAPLRKFEYLLKMVPLGAQYYVQLEK